MCARRHSHDIARSGYINLLQPQDRRSSSPGDSKDVVQARARVLAAGVGRPLVDAVVQRTMADNLPEHALVVDVGSGTGEALGALVAARRISGVGIDLSVAAADHAARRFPAATWLVANADRGLPVADHRASVVMSLHGRRRPDECARILLAGGRLIVAVPAPDDLIELRASVQGDRIERERAGGVIAEHEHQFTLLNRFTIRDQLDLECDVLQDLFRITYRAGRVRSWERLAVLTRLAVTVASEVLVFVPRGHQSSFRSTVNTP